MDKLDIVKNVFEQRSKDDEVSNLERVIKYQRLYEDPLGKFVLNDILKLCGYGEVPLGRDDNETQRFIGQLQIGTEIVQRLEADLSKMKELEENENGVDLQI